MYGKFVTYDDFALKLADYKAEYKTATGRELETVKELESYLIQRQFRLKRGKSLRSLKGLL